MELTPGGSGPRSGTQQVLNKGSQTSSMGDAPLLPGPHKPSKQLPGPSCLARQAPTGSCPHPQQAVPVLHPSWPSRPWEPPPCPPSPGISQRKPPSLWPGRPLAFPSRSPQVSGQAFLALGPQATRPWRGGTHRAGQELCPPAGQWTRGFPGTLRPRGRPDLPKGQLN